MPITTLPLGVTAVMLPELEFDEQLALCNEVGVTHYSIRPRIIPDDQRDKPYGNWGNHKFDLTPKRLLAEAKQIRKQLDAAGLTPHGTVPGASVVDSDDDLKVHFEGAATVGAGCVRVAPQRYPEGAFDYQKELAKVVDQYGRVIGIAKSYKVKVVIETHCYSFATSPALALNICKNFTPAEIGTIFDIANFSIEGNLVPNLAVAVLGEYIDHVHIGGGKRVTTGYDAAGFRTLGRTMTPMTETDLYIPDWLKALDEAGRHVPLVIEDFTPSVPGAERLRAAAAALKRAMAML